MNSLHLDHARAYAAYRVEPRDWDTAPRGRRPSRLPELLASVAARLRRRTEETVAEITTAAEAVVTEVAATAEAVVTEVVDAAEPARAAA